MQEHFESILKNSDLEEWIAENEQKYLDKAKEAWKNEERQESKNQIYRQTIKV